MKTLIAVLTCVRNSNLVRLSRETWVPRATASGYDVQFFDGARCHCTDDYLSVVPKIMYMFKWAAFNGYGRMLKLADDTYVRVDRLRDFGVDYGGHIWPACDFGIQRDGIVIPDAPAGTYPYNFVSGGAVWLSRKSILIASNAAPNGDWTDDRWTGDVLARGGIAYTALPEIVLRHNANQGYCACTPANDMPYVCYMDAGERMPELHKEMLGA